jgi:hypothetical protein
MSGVCKCRLPPLPRRVFQEPLVACLEPGRLGLEARLSRHPDPDTVQVHLTFQPLERPHSDPEIAGSLICHGITRPRPLWTDAQLPCR